MINLRFPTYRGLSENERQRVSNTNEIQMRCPAVSPKVGDGRTVWEAGDILRSCLKACKFLVEFFIIVHTRQLLALNNHIGSVLAAPLR